MPTLTTGCITSLRVPEAFTVHDEEFGGYGGTNWSHKYRIWGKKYPEISSRYSGFPVPAYSAAAFRELLAKGPHIVFDTAQADYCQDEHKEVVSQVSPALGNSGDNQISNTNEGYDAALFKLERMEVVHLNARPVLQIRGHFHTLEMEPRVFLNCYFIDADPKAKDCRVEELYMQAFPEDILKEHQADFQHVLDSINWSN